MNNYEQFCDFSRYKRCKTYLGPMLAPESIDIESLQNRLLKVCYVPATNAILNRLLFFSFDAAINNTNEANKAGSACH
jgi:hypothetical protein